MTTRQHGTRACYVHGPSGIADGKGCRCAPCREANRVAERKLRQQPAPPYVAADRARSHIKHLMAQGFGFKAQATAAGVSVTAVSKIIYGDPHRGQALTKRIRPATEKALLGLTLDDAPDSARVIDPARYLSTLEELHRRGWTYTLIADAIGVSPSNLKPKGASRKVTAGRWRAVLALLDQAPPLIGADEKGHNAAAIARANTWDPEAERRKNLRRAARAESTQDARLPVLDLAALAAQKWRARSACRLVPDDQTWIFWALEADHQAMDAARKVCASCTVADQCLTEALRSGETGFWGGHTEAERQELVTLEATA